MFFCWCWNGENWGLATSTAQLKFWCRDEAKSYIWVSRKQLPGHHTTSLNYSSEERGAIKYGKWFWCVPIHQLRKIYNLLKCSLNIRILFNWMAHERHMIQNACLCIYLFNWFKQLASETIHISSRFKSTQYYNICFFINVPFLFILRKWFSYLFSFVEKDKINSYLPHNSIAKRLHWFNPIKQQSLTIIVLCFGLDLF